MEFLKLSILNPPKRKKNTIGRLYTRMSPIDSCKINAKLSICLEKKFAVAHKIKFSKNFIISNPVNLEQNLQT